jgi:hypothetical protein
MGNSSRAGRSSLRHLSLSLACALGAAAGCSNNNAVTPPPGTAGTAAPMGTEMNPVGVAGTSGGAAGMTSTGTTSPTGAAGTSSGAAGKPAAGSGGAGTGAAGTGAAGTGTAAAGTGAAGADAAGTGATPAAGSGGTAGSAGATAMTPALKDCVERGDPGPCGTYMASNGMKIQFGPYGASVDRNVGKGFEVPVSAGDSDGGATCEAFSAGFAENPEDTATLLDTGDLNFALYTVFRPAVTKDGEKYPIITWGNGTCAQPEGYGPLLRFVASHGFYVVAPNSRWVGSNSPMTKALDFMFKANEDSSSPYFGKLDTTKVGAMGHSQGGGATVTAARDERVKSVIIFNYSTSASKKFLAVSGDRDLFGATGASMKSAVNASSVPGAFMYFHMIVGTGTASGHLTLMTQPERLTDATAAWWKLTLNDDAEAKKFFVGTDCTLCNRKDEFEYGQKGLE